MDVVTSVSICKIFFAFITFSMVSVGTLINAFESYLPVFITKTFRYGKFASTEDYPFLHKFELPKSYFRHFYRAAIVISPVFLNEVISVYVFQNGVQNWFTIALDTSCGESRVATVPKRRVFLAVVLMMLQIYRRFYDTHFVSVFSRKATINLTHYLIGMVFYPAALLIILSEAPVFAPNPIKQHSYNGSHFEITRAFQDVNSPVPTLGVVEVIATVVFMWAWYHQHVATVILANLRKNVKGEIVSQSYKIPEGGLFNYLSSPHSSTEILMYTAITLLLYKNTGWWYVYAWVLSNQVETILLSHWWYQEHFKDFPKQRRALVPFVY